MRRLILAVSAASIALVVLPGEARPPARALAQPGPIVSIDARQSGNWAGYNLGYLSNGRKLFNQVSGTWTVPTPSLRRSGENEYSSNWVGIGGGCVNANCLVTDATLIQTGTASEITSSGQRTYYGWWEIIPGPALRLANFSVRAGDRMFGEVRAIVPGSNLWRVRLINFTTGQLWKTTIAYASTRLTAEWIEEAPLINGLQSSIPSLTNPRFNDAVVNDAPAYLQASDEIQLSGAGNLATPSAPDPDHNGFNVCTYTGSCGAPGSP